MHKTSGPKPTPPAERIWQNITIVESGCWEWPSGDRYGYGCIWVGSRTDGTRRAVKAHRASYELFVGPIPDGLHLDHLCRNPPCVNPDHLEPVTPGENVRRGTAPAAIQARQTHCKRGHAFTPENTYTNQGKRYCRACRPLR